MRREGTVILATSLLGGNDSIYEIQNYPASDERLFSSPSLFILCVQGWASCSNGAPSTISNFGRRSKSISQGRIFYTQTESTSLTPFQACIGLNKYLGGY